MAVTKRHGIYSSAVIYPMTMDTECHTCGCKIQVQVFNCQQKGSKKYCFDPCTPARVRPRMSPMKLLWSESWSRGTATPESVNRQEEYVRELRKSKGITEEAIHAAQEVLEVHPDVKRAPYSCSIASRVPRKGADKASDDVDQGRTEEY